MTADSGRGAKTPGPPALLLGVTIVLTAVNLRTATTSVGALLREIQADLAMSDTVAGVLTTMPLVAFGVFGLAAGVVARRFGTSRVLVVSLALMTVGLIARAVAPDVGWMLALTLVTLIGGSAGNVLVPVAVKAWFPGHVSTMTGLYVTAVLIGASVPATVSVQIAAALGGWRFGLGFWAVPAALALIPWLVVGLRTRAARAVDERGAQVVPRPREEQRAIARRVRRNPRSWALMVYFGLQSLEAYVAMGWLPAILRDAGLAPARAGAMLGVAMAVSAIAALVVPIGAGRTGDQRWWVVGLSAFGVVGYFGLLIAPSAAPVTWTVLIGVGLGAFPIALLVVGLRCRTSEGTAALSSLTQGYGYLLAILGPLGVGFLHDVSGGWSLPLGAMIALLIPKLIAGWIAAKPGYVDDPPGSDPHATEPPAPGPTSTSEQVTTGGPRR